MSEKIPHWAFVFVRLRWFFLIAASVLTLFFGFFAAKLTFNFSPDNIYLSSDPAYQFYVSRFIEQFGERGNLCIIAIDGDAKKNETQKALKELHSLLEKVPEVKSIRSLANTSIYKEHEGVMQMVPVLSDDLEANRKMIDWVRHDKMMQNLLISEKGDAPTLMIQLPRHLGDQAATDKVVIDLKKAIERIASKYPQLNFHLAGAPVLQQEAITTLKGDQLLFVPLVVLLMAILLWLSFHSFWSVILSFLATSSATIWTLGWLVLRGHPLDIVNNKLIVLLLVIGTSCAVQILARFQDELLFAVRKRGLDEIDHNVVVASTVYALTLPCFLTTMTAALGFGAVVVAKISIIRNFGVDAAVGVMSSYVTTMLFVPALLRILPLPKEKPTRFFKYISGKMSLDFMLSAIARFSMRYATWIIAASILITLIGLWIAKDIRANQRLASELPLQAPSVLALHFIEEKLTGIMPFDVVFEGEPSRLLEPDVIRAGAFIETQVASLPLKPTMRSFSDLLFSLDRSLKPNEEIETVSNWSDDKIAQLVLLFDMGDPSLVAEAKQDFISSDGRFYRIQGLLKDANTKDISEFSYQLLEKVEKIKLDGVTTHLTGAAIISSNALGYMINTMISSLVVAMIAIFILVLILLRSFRFAFIVLFPNLVPIVTTIAFMQLLGISLRVATVMTFSMALGIAVDACIYLVTRFREEAILHQLSTDDVGNKFYQKIIELTMRGSGRPVVYTTLMLLAGFSVLGLSDFAALRDFSILASITLATALVVDLLLWPALIIKVKPNLSFVKN